MLRRLFGRHFERRRAQGRVGGHRDFGRQGRRLRLRGLVGKGLCVQGQGEESFRFQCLQAFAASA